MDAEVGLQLCFTHTTKTGFPQVFIRNTSVKPLFLNYGKYSKISNTFLFLFSIQGWNSHNYCVKSKMEDPDQSDLDLGCLSRPFWQATSIRNFRIFTVYDKLLVPILE